MSSLPSSPQPFPAADLEAELRLFIPLPDADVPSTSEPFLSGPYAEVPLEHLYHYLRAAPLCASREVLDVACGRGYGAFCLSRVARSVLGVGLDRDAIAHARSHYRAGNLHFEVGNGTALPTSDRSVDVVVSFSTLEHIGEPERFLQEVRRVLRPDGVLVIAIPDKEADNRQVSAPRPSPVREFTRSDFEALLRPHFAHVALRRQRTLISASLLGDGQGPGGLPLPLLSAIQETICPVTISVRSVGGPYLIALCSNGEGQTLSQDALEGASQPDPFRALQGGSTEGGQLIIQLTYLAAQHAGQVRELQVQLAGREEDLRRMRKRLARSEEAAGFLQERFAVSLGEVEQLRGQVADREGQLERARRQLARYEGQLTDYEGQLERARRQLADYEGQLGWAQGQLADCEGQLERARRQLAEYERQLGRVHGRLAESEGQLGRIHGQRAEYEGQLGRLGQELAACQGEAASLREQLEALQGSRSWRLTRPLRLASRVGRRLSAAGVRRLARLLQASGLSDPD